LSLAHHGRRRAVAVRVSQIDGLWERFTLDTVSRTRDQNVICFVCETVAGGAHGGTRGCAV